MSCRLLWQLSDHLLAHLQWVGAHIAKLGRHIYAAGVANGANHRLKRFDGHLAGKVPPIGGRMDLFCDEQVQAES